jgi:hypothetical protein
MKTAYRTQLQVLLIAVSLGGTTMCRRGATPSAGSSPSPSPSAEAVVVPVVHADAAAAATGNTLTPSGPSAELTGPHYVLNVALAPPAAVPGDSTLTVAFHGSNGFHVNDRAPTTLDLQTSNATTPRPQLGPRDAAERTEQVASFRVPVQVTGTGATVRGTATGWVCRIGDQGICERFEQQFAVALP